MYVLNPLQKEDLLNLLDHKAQEVIIYFIKKSLFSQPEPLPKQTVRAIQIPKEHIEQWFVQALDVSPIGAGSYPVDIYNKEEGWAADIKMLNVKLNSKDELTKSESGEASLGQKFEGAGIDLDTMFANHQYEHIKDSWLAIFKNKVLQVEKDYPEIKEIIYLFILRAKSSFYLVGCKVDINCISKVKVSNSTTSKSVFLNNFIDEKYGKVKIYKAKKRLELRLRPKQWVDDKLAILFNTDFVPINMRLYDQKIDEDFLREQFDRINSVNITIS